MASPKVLELSRPIITSSHDNSPNGLYARTLAKITVRHHFAYPELAGCVISQFKTTTKH